MSGSGPLRRLQTPREKEAWPGQGLKNQKITGIVVSEWGDGEAGAGEGAEEMKEGSGTFK